MTEGHTEGSPWFWKIFGGTILGMITVLLVTLFSNLHNVITDNKNELATQINELRSDIKQNQEAFSDLKERLVAVEQGFSKERFQVVDEALKAMGDDIEAQKTTIIGLESSADTNKEDIKGVHEELKDLSKQIQDMREKIASLTPVIVEPKEKPPTAKP